MRKNERRGRCMMDLSFDSWRMTLSYSRCKVRLNDRITLEKASVVVVGRFHSFNAFHIRMKGETLD
jgi:hypothetical protein